MRPERFRAHEQSEVHREAALTLANCKQCHAELHQLLHTREAPSASEFQAALTHRRQGSGIRQAERRKQFSCVQFCLGDAIREQLRFFLRLLQFANMCLNTSCSMCVAPNPSYSIWKQRVGRVPEVVDEVMPHKKRDSRAICVEGGGFCRRNSNNSLSNSCFWLLSGTKGASVKGELNFRKMSSVSLAYPFTGFSSPGGFHKLPNVPLRSCKSLSTAVKCIVNRLPLLSCFDT